MTNYHNNRRSTSDGTDALVSLIALMVMWGILGSMLIGFIAAATWVIKTIWGV